MTIQVATGTRLGPYEIISRIGAGGMGEVWRALDTRLDRHVAIKLLPASLADSEQFRARFEREAKTISQLNHPNICTLHDVGHENGVSYLVMELLEGESLADRLAHDPLPLIDVLRYGTQIAAALDRAHRAGIVHRDLKPGNVVITKSGAKLLDFGLAKSSAASSPAINVDGATAQKPLTQEGTILGTFQYMAPEQLEGQEADARTDIFALGALLYEMATGRRAFEGKTKTSLIAAIVSSQPEPISSIAPMSPPLLDHVVRKCLEKDPDDRWQSAHDVMSELQWIGEAGSQAGLPRSLTASRRQRRHLLLAAAITGWIIVAAGSMWAIVEWRRLEPSRRPLRAEILPPAEATFAPVLQGPVVLSPDGRRLLSLVVLKSQRLTLTVRDLASGKTRMVDGTEDATFPFWSPDSAWIGFFSDEKLKRVPADGGPVQILCDAHAGRGGSWGDKGVIVFAPDIGGPLMKVSSEGGVPVVVTKVEGKDSTHRNPHFLPDGKHFLFITRQNNNGMVGAVVAGSIGGDEQRELVVHASNPQYARGWLFFVRDRNLLAQRFSVKSFELKGPLIPIAESVEYYNSRDVGNFSVSATGVLAYRQSFLQNRQLAWYDQSGKELATVGAAAHFLRARASGDGRVAAIAQSDPAGNTSDIWMMDLTSGQITRATSLHSTGISAMPSYDGSQLAIADEPFLSRGSFWIQPSSGGGSGQKFPASNGIDITDWSRDGKLLVGWIQLSQKGRHIVSFEAGKPEALVQRISGRFDEVTPRLSPDGRWLTYTSDETGSLEVFVSDFPAGRRKWQISASGGWNSIWSRDGRAIYYQHQGGKIFNRDMYYQGIVNRVTVSGSDQLRLGVPAPIPTPPEASLIAVIGDRLLMMRPASLEVPEPIRLVQNWEAILTEKK